MIICDVTSPAANLPGIAALSAPECLDMREITAAQTGRADAYRCGWAASPPRPGIGARFAALWARLIGIESVTPFADRRLEMLRLFACMVRRGDARLPAVANELMAAGYSARALRQVIGIALA